ncbi:uncharacterized protein LOC108141687 [Drosophila elegans]|uniref:uncharacterized protein LOC108141687 n=1 Tax=Drosophila elegans TaxID=30023 RepID=UPI0007E5FBBB|nr:uncharacterized protein LOC108141687 [Drosophila elegans]
MSANNQKQMAMTRKAKCTRLENPPMSQSYRQQVNDDFGQPKEKVPKMSNNRRNKSSKQQVQDPPTTRTKAVGPDTNQMNYFDLTRASKNPIRAFGGGGGAAVVAQKYQSRLDLNNQTSKTIRPPVTTGSIQKLTPKEIREFRESKELKSAMEPKETRELQETKEFKELKELREPQAHKAPKDAREKVANKSPNRASRHNSNKTKNYFDKYLKFAFDLSTPEGVQKLDAHFFPNQSIGQDPNAPASSNL